MTGTTIELLDELLDAAEQTDDFVSGVLGLAAGRLGGDVAAGQSWLSRRLTEASARFRLGKGQVAEGFAAAYGPEQLRKASIEAGRMVATVDRLRVTGSCAELLDRLDELQVAGMPDRLAVLSPSSAELRELHRGVSAARRAVQETRTRLLLGRRNPG